MAVSVEDLDRGSTTISTSSALVSFTTTTGISTSTTVIEGTTVRGNILQATPKAPVPTSQDSDNGSTIISTTTLTAGGSTIGGDIRQATARNRFPRRTTPPPKTKIINSNKRVRISTSNMHPDLISSTSTVETPQVITDGTTMRGAAFPTTT